MADNKTSTEKLREYGRKGGMARNSNKGFGSKSYEWLVENARKSAEKRKKNLDGKAYVE